MALRLGKLPARKGAVKLLLKNYVDLSRLPTPPTEFGHEGVVVGAWGMLANDQWGNCVFAGAAHETMLWRREVGLPVAFTDAAVLGDYAALTGFAFTNETDQGTDMQAAASYRKKVGIADAAGARHRISAYLAIEAGNLLEHLIGAWLFGAVGVGVRFPGIAMTQFDAGLPWTPVRGAEIDGGHYVPMVARRGGNSAVVTWGMEQAMTDAWLAEYNDESILYLSEEMLSGGRSVDGFDLDHLQADLAALRGVAQPRSVTVTQDPKLAAAKLAAAVAAIKAELPNLFPQWEINLIPNFDQNVVQLAGAALTAGDRVEEAWQAKQTPQAKP